ncbi:CYFA0S04e00496g1_1 [Cyberlindnera fabianii]|uniref:Protein farnesyltransferase/geranylgeranyltransferase type-1 subunit alpha n=1 Tax=Cyberlindnera fabianii TaxID=36022 RepID=A0A061AQR5_CYBFA|nr:CYFA0S04e00496g1_1 [Cyberlindnera fabianii]
MTDAYNYDDLEPLPLNLEGVNIATIMYSDEYKHTLGLLRALQAKKEYSDRALALTADAIALNAAHYTLWQYRYHNVIELKKDIDAELNWVEDIAIDNPKNYQIWHYRQMLLEYWGKKDAKREFPIIETMLDDDTKNYHVWSYRKWVVQWTGQWEQELSFVEKFIERDVYNNSAWSHRFFAVFGLGLDQVTDQVFEREVKYAKEQIALAPHNVSSWNYLIGVFNKLNKPLAPLKDFASQYATITDSMTPIQSIPALELLTKIYKTSEPDLAIKGYELLGSKYDTIRRNYWDYQKSLIVQTN